MSEVSKKKKKKRHHSSSSNDLEAPSKRIKVEPNSTAWFNNDSIVFSSTPVGLNCDDSIVEGRQKKKHKHRHSTGVDVSVAEHGNNELNRTSTPGQYDMSVERQAYTSGLDKHTSHKMSIDTCIEQQESPRQQQSMTNSNQTIDRLCPPELRFQQPAGFAEVHPSTSHIWWEDVAGNEHKELWLVRAPADCLPSTLDHCPAVIGESVQYSTNEGDSYSVSVQEPSDQSGRLVVLLPSRYDHKYRLASPIHSFVTVTKNIFNKPDTEEESKSNKKKKKHKHAKHERTKHVENS